MTNPLPSSESATRRAAKRVAGRNSTIRRSIEQRFATRRARRRLVTAWTVTLLATGVAPLIVRLQDVYGAALQVGDVGMFLTTAGIPSLPLFALAALLGWLVRLSVRDLADLPDDSIDERQIALRDRTCLIAYRVFAATIMWLLLAGYIIATARATEDIAASVATWIAADMFFFVAVLVLFLPSAILAWYQPNDEEVSHD